MSRQACWLVVLSFSSCCWTLARCRSKSAICRSNSFRASPLCLLALAFKASILRLNSRRLCFGFFLIAISLLAGGCVLSAFLQRAGNAREQVLGCCCSQLERGACNFSDCPTLECLRSGQRQVRIFERKVGDHTVAWEEIHASPILDGSGRLIQVVEVWRDISERRAAEAKLAESYRLASVGVLASGFSHEMNTPLATTLMCVEGILRDTPAGHEWQIDQATNP